MPWKLLEFGDDVGPGGPDKKARFLIDENVHVGTVPYLRDHGWNAKSLDDVGLTGHPDENVFNYALGDDRVVVTHDNDFLNDQKFPPHRNPGIVVVPGAGGNLDSFIPALLLLMALGSMRSFFWKAKIVLQGNGDFSVTRQYSDTGAMETITYRFERNGSVLIWEDPE